MGTVISAIDVDYLIMGAGAAGMAFADSLFTESDATMVIVDRHDRPGGHWNDAYPFVRLHQPSANYGVNSADLGTGPSMRSASMLVSMSSPPVRRSWPTTTT